jgi:glucosamine-phosphate N-acetyltransferase
MEHYYFRKLMVQDYNSNYFELLSQLSPTSKPTYNEWITFVTNLNPTQHQVVVVVSHETDKIVATGTVFIEQKVIRNMGKVAHIEDVVVDSGFRGKGIGKELITYLQDIALTQSVYKITLDCLDKNAAFYEKCGFEKNGCQMILKR